MRASSCTTDHPPPTASRRGPARGRRRAVLSAVTVAVLALTPTSASAYPGPGHVSGDVVVHDPSMVRSPTGQYLLYSTGDGLQLRTSDDRVSFRHGGSAFAARPSWWGRYNNGTNDVWAPDVSFHGGRYLMYYSVSTFGSNRSAIGLATSTTGRPGSWRDAGVVYSSSPSNDYNAIDPNLFVDDDGRWWLSFGSHWTGLKMIRLDPSTGKQYRLDSRRRSLATTGSTQVEAPHVVKRGGYYYLFASYDRCCAGTASTYNIKVGRATSVTGPYVDRSGRRLLDGGGTPVLASQGSVVGPGGQSVLSDVDGDLLVYHYYDGRDRGTPKLGVNLLDWSTGWPVAY